MKHIEHVSHFKKLAENLKSEHERWLCLRKCGIGASEVGSILGVNKYRNQIDVYLDKVNDDVNYEDNEKMKVGRLMESSLLSMFEKESGIKCIDNIKTKAHDEHNFLFASPDGFTQDMKAGVEIKTGMNGDHWEDVPDQYYAQCQLSMLVFGVDTWHLYALLAGFTGFERKHFIIKRNDLYINSLITICKEFWFNHVLERKAPDARTMDDINNLFKESNKIEMVANDDVKKIIEGYKKIKLEMIEIENKLKPLKILEKQLKERLGLSMQDAEIITNENGDELLNYKIVNRSSVDVNRLKDECPTVYNQYVKNSTYRKLTLKR